METWARWVWGGWCFALVLAFCVAEYKLQTAGTGGGHADGQLGTPRSVHRLSASGSASEVRFLRFLLSFPAFVLKCYSVLLQLYPDFLNFPSTRGRLRTQLGRKSIQKEMTELSQGGTWRRLGRVPAFSAAVNTVVGVSVRI